MQNNGTYIEQFLKLNKCGFYDLKECENKEKPLKVALVNEWYLDDKIEGMKHETSKIRLEVDDKLIFLSDVKALLLATEIMKKLAEKQGADVVEVVKRLAYDLEVNL
jgi:hypothetical protein